MAKSAPVFGLAFDAGAARAALQEAVAGRRGPSRVRLTLDEAGRHKASAHDLAPDPSHWTYALSRARTHSADLLLRHKTNWRDLYDGEAARAETDEILFTNERGELTEGARSNVFVRRGDELLTPPLAAGLLPGCLRAALIAQGKAREAVLYPADLEGEVLLGNSLRGLIAARRA
jgi:branched-subunit amino acid aminotransferase/4-amino-4-deoxychorismate lyase